MKNHMVLPEKFPRRPGRHRRDIRSAFSLTELLVSISIVGILLAIAFPAAQAVRQAARRTHCLSNLKQVMLATLAYESKGIGFPPGDDGRGQGFIVPLLPFFEEQKLSDQAKDDWASGETYADRWSRLSRQQVVQLICPAASPEDYRATLAGQGEFTGHYYGVTGPIGTAQDSEGSRIHSYRDLGLLKNGPIGLQGIFSPQKNGVFASKRPRDVTDGISNTIGIGEISRFEVVDETRDPMRSGWAFGAGYDSAKKVTRLFAIKSISGPINAPGVTLNDTPFGSNHPGGTHFALLDGSVHHVSQNVSLDVLKAYASINEREKVQSLDEL